MLGVTGPTGPVSFRVSVEACAFLVYDLRYNFEIALSFRNFLMKD